jgi:uncharacterized membrane protein YjjP (DUF1212 family)
MGTTIDRMAYGGIIIPVVCAGNELKPKMLISLHVNWSSKPSRRGAVVIYRLNQPSYILANIVQDGGWKMTQRERNLEVECFVLAGSLLMQSGAETYRAEDTMMRMAASQGYSEAESFVTPTGILFSTGHGYPMKIAQINKRSIQLDKISRINEVSRKLSSHQITVEEAYEALKEIDRSRYFLNLVWQIFFAALGCGGFIILFQGTFLDIPSAAAAGGLGYTTLALFNRMTKVKLFAEFVASIVVGLVAGVAVNTGLGLEANKIIISAVMPLVPGVAIANAVRDLMAGHLVSGLSKGAEACLTALAIGSGIAVTLNV